MTEDEMVGGDHRLNGYEFEQTLGDSEGPGSLVCCSPWGRKESDTTKVLTRRHILGPRDAWLQNHHPFIPIIFSNPPHPSPLQLSHLRAGSPSWAPLQLPHH